MKLTEQGRYDEAGDVGETILDYEVRQRRIVDGLQRHQSAMNPPPPAQLTSEEKQAKPWDKCNWNDSFEWASNSKHGVDPDAFRAGCEEVLRRRGLAEGRNICR
jgi:hypothetical protein